MRKVVMVEMVAVDGLMEKLKEWDGPYSDDEMTRPLARKGAPPWQS